MALTLTGVSLLGAVDPFAPLRAWLTEQGATTRLQPAHEDPHTIDVAHGENLLATLPAVPPPGNTRRIVVIGNSQQYTASLPRGARPQLERRARLASDLLAEQLETRAPGTFSVYNLSAPNQTLVEALWQGLYWFRVSPTPPRVLIVQASFDMFRKTGIRPGFQSLLDDPSFVRALDGHLAAGTTRSYAEDIVAARRDLQERRQQAAAGTRWSLERSLRHALEVVPLYRRREELRASFFSTLYELRVKLLRISPTTRRHIAGQPFNQSVDALTDLVRVARERQATVLLYNAPVNPAVSMFFEDEYQKYLVTLRQLCATEGCHFADLANAVAPQQWGYWIDGPDPIHVDETGHVTIADRLLDAFGPVLLPK